MYMYILVIEFMSISVIINNQGIIILNGHNQNGIIVVSN